MKRDKGANNGADANSVLKKHLSEVQRRKRRRLITIIVIIVLVLAAIAFVVLKLRNSVAENYGSSESAVESAEVSVGSISTTISGSGTLEDDDVEDVEVMDSVEIDTVFVEEGDSVEEGDIIASVDTSSVVSAMADLQDELDEIDEELEEVSDDTVDSKIKSSVSGRVKKIYAAEDDDIATVMYENGALMLISMDGLMAVDIETDSDIAEEDEVVVTLSDGSTVDGTVESVEDGIAVVTMTDNGPEYCDTVTVADEDGSTLGTGELYIHSEIKVTGYAGTVSSLYVSENDKVSSSTKLIYLTDTSYSANYDSLLKERESLEEDLDELIKLYKEGAVFAPISGIIYSVDYDEDSSSTDATSENMATNTDDTTSADSTSESYITIATVCPNSTMSVSVEMDESDILSMEEGQEATVTIDSIGDEEFTGTVSEVNTSSSSSGGVTVFTIEVTIEKTDDMLASMSASVDIIIDGVENALLIPEDAVSQTSSTSYVYTEYDEETGELDGMTEVETGISNGSNIEIISGLSEGDTVYYEEADDDTGFDMGNMGNMGDMGDMGGGEMTGGGEAPSGMDQGGMTGPGGQ